MDKFTEKLKKIGLGDHEAMVYATLVASSPNGAANIARKCSLSRSSVYTTLNSLIAKGLVGTTYKNDVKQFIAEDISSLDELLNQEKHLLKSKFMALEHIQDDFLTLQKIGANIPHIIFFEGQEGLKKIYLSMMRQAPPESGLYLLRDEFVWSDDWGFIFEPEWHDRVKRLKIEKNISTRLLVNPSKTEREQAKFYNSKKAIDCRFLPKNHTVKQFAMYIIGDIVSILSMEQGGLVGIKITNQHLAENFKTIFENLWQTSEK